MAACSNDDHPAPSPGPVSLSARCLQPKTTAGTLRSPAPQPTPSSSVTAKPPHTSPPNPPVVWLNTAWTLMRWEKPHPRVTAALSKGDSNIQVLISLSNLVPLYFLPCKSPHWLSQTCGDTCLGHLYLGHPLQQIKSLHGPQHLSGLCFSWLCFSWTGQ